MKRNQIKIVNSKFIENLSGLYGSGLNIANIKNNHVLIDKSKFIGNTGAFSIFED